MKLTDSFRTHWAIPSRSARSITIWVPAACATRSVLVTCILRIVSAAQSPFRNSGPNPRACTSMAPGKSRFWCEWTTPFGRPVVPLVYAIAATSAP